MATMAERKAESIRKEIEKLSKSLERYEGRLAKKTAKCEELNCVWTRDEHYELMTAGKTTDKQEIAWFEMRVAQSEVEDTQSRLENAQKRYDKATGKVEEVKVQIAEDNRIARIETEWLTKTAEERRAEYEAWLKKFKAECREDGIEIEEATATWISGTSAKGYHFIMYLNSGWTERSRHCYTLRIDGETIFTSGDFATGYRYIKR